MTNPSHTGEEFPCPDCSLVIRMGADNIHDPGCPLAAQEDERALSDKKWFEAHPFADEFWRKPTWTENSIHRAMEGKEVWRMKVVKVDENHRVRYPHTRVEI